jgi:xanthine dehydrogenase large subunit
MKNIDSNSHVTGKSIYVDDIPEIKDTLYGVVFASPIAHGRIISVDYAQAWNVEGVIDIITYEDIPGENQIGGIFPDEPLFAEEEVHFEGMPIALIIATSEHIAFKARKLISIEIEKKEIITDPRIAKEKGALIFPPRTFKLGHPEDCWQHCTHIFEGRADSNGQEHLYIETQGAYAVPMENGHIRIASSTQGPTAVQRTVAKVLGLPMHKIEVDVVRLGGGFGGKEDQASAWAVMAALAAKISGKPIKVILSRLDDMKMTGKRHPYSADYKIGLSEDLKILAYQVTFYQNAGAATDLSPAVMERTLFHCTNAYYIPNVEATAYSCKTNLPPNTAFRGFGGPQGMFVIESAIAHAASELKIPTHVLQSKNVIIDGNVFPYGQIADNAEMLPVWNDFYHHFSIVDTEHDIADFNKNNLHFKKGMALAPICFGISFTKTPMNNARALVHIYSDGSVGISTGAVEMGQGVNTKMLQVAADLFSIQPSKIKIESTNTTRVANTSPSAASATADLNGKAVEIACKALIDRLKECAAKHLETSSDAIQFQEDKILINDEATEMTWESLIEKAFLDRICLTENGHYATPTIHFDKSIEKGHPFAYHVYGLAMIVVTVDCIRGRYEFDSVKIVHDFGKTMNNTIDMGQIEGGLVQGMGWMTLENIKYDEKGSLKSNTLSTYKVPDIYFVPKEVIIEPLQTDNDNMAIFKSKAVGEPPLMYGLGAYFAIQNAIKAFNPNYKMEFDAPMTPEKTLLSLYSK